MTRDATPPTGEPPVRPGAGVSDSSADAAPGSHAASAAFPPALDAGPDGEERTAFLARASKTLGTTLDSAATAENIALLAVPGLADMCLVDLTVAGRPPVRATAVHADPALEPALRELPDGPPVRRGTARARALQTGEPQAGRAGTGDAPPWAAGSAEACLMEELGAVGWLVLPLRSRGQNLALITLVSADRPEHPDDFGTAVEFAHRAAAALDNALLYESAVRSLAAAETAQERTERLLEELQSTDRTRRLAELQLMESEHFTRTIIASVQQGIIVYDLDLRCQLWNRFMEELSGLPATRVIGTRAPALFPQLAEPGLDGLLKRALRGEAVRSPDLQMVPVGGGSPVWTSCVFSPHYSRTGETMGVVGIVHDITGHKDAEEKLVHNALHDALTGLPNRTLFLDRLEQLLKHSSRDPDFVFGVAFMDLDRFKVVNDSLGHLRGDDLLVAIARRLEHCVRQGDTVARLGGDEFAILLDGVRDVRDATRVAERILEEIGQPFQLAGSEVFTAASIGIALSAGDYDLPEDILRDADTAMYRAKMDGRCRYEVFDRGMHDSAVRTLQLETDLRRALERDEFRIHYQPIVDLERGRISGVEALVRWQHPARGLVPPDDFIPLAEETGLIVAIGWWVLEESCRQMRHWHDTVPAAADLYVSVNLSPRQFVHAGLLEVVDEILARTGLPATALKLEITESVVIHHQDAVTAALHALRQRGIQLCIDDFGTGYSSLSYLHSFPVDTLKIDRSFIRQIGITTNNPRLVETIVTLGQHLGMQTVAEGVETAEQLCFLRDLGPLSAQGFLFARPLEPAAVERLLRSDPSW